MSNSTLTAIGRTQPAHACPVCGGDGLFGYRNSAGELDYYCADHRLAQSWAEARLTSSSHSEGIENASEANAHAEPARGNVSSLLDGEAPAPASPVVDRQVVLQRSRPGPESIKGVKPTAREPYYDADGRFIHRCRYCGKEASFGFGVSLREGKLGSWCCKECLRDNPTTTVGY
jgi:hypothetical protein